MATPADGTGPRTSRHPHGLRVAAGVVLAAAPVAVAASGWDALGANHAMFGDDGEQPGDGTATVDRATAQQQIVDATVAALRSLG